MEANYILIDDVKIYKGNFAFAYKYSKSLYEVCYEAEKKVLTNGHEAMSLFRTVMETFGYETEVERRLKEESSDKGEIQRRLNNELKDYDRNTGKPRKTKKQLFLATMDELQESYKDEFIRVVNNAYRYFGSIKRGNNLPNSLTQGLYGLCSESSHGIGGRQEDAINMAKTIHSILSMYYNNTYRFDKELIPIDDYIPVPGKMCSKLRISDYHMDMYVKENGESTDYYILKATAGEKNTRNRNSDIINALWNSSVYTPQSVVYYQGEIGEGERKRDILRMPGRPESLDYAVRHMPTEEKWDILKGITEALETMHSMKPVVTHRSLSPRDFVVCKIKDVQRVFLYNFETAKQVEVDYEYTVASVIEERKEVAARAPYIAPEVLKKEVEDKWADRADIFSLAKIAEFVLGKNEALKVKGLLSEMEAVDFCLRPDIKEVKDRLYLAKREYHYYVYSEKKPGKSQEDSFYVEGCEEHIGEELNISGTCTETFSCGVFDGLGGGLEGAKISEYVARLYKKLWESSTKSNPEIIFPQIVSKIQIDTRRYMEEEWYDYAGSTLAVAGFFKEKVCMVNVGDSRVYVINAKGSTLLSKDHRFSKSIAKKRELYQYIGIEEDGFVLEPYINVFNLEKGDYALICTDGLSDYIDEKEMQAIVSGTDALDKKLNKMALIARENGSKDDITAILIRGEEK